MLREGVRLIQERETRLAALDASIARGVADADAGRLQPLDAVFDRLEAIFMVIFYHIEGDRIVILHVLHGASDNGSILFPS